MPPRQQQTRPSSPPDPRRKRTRKISSSSSSHLDSDSDVDAIHFEPEHVDISDESPRPKRRRCLGGAHTIPTRATSDESLEETPRYRKPKGIVILDSDSDSRPPRRKLIKGIRPPTPEEEDDDILEAENLLDSRLRSRGRMTAFQKNLEKFKTLKGKKRGQVVSESSSEEEEEESSADVPFKSAKLHHSGGSSASDRNSESSEEGFIVSDDAHGLPATQLPVAFSLSSHQDLTHQFKIVCQLFVHLAVQPLSDRRPFLELVLKEEEYFSVALQVTRRKLCGIRDSLVASSVWKADFKKALETYPRFTLASLDFAIPQCDACHLGGRVSKLVGRLGGHPYDEYDFEDLSDDESSEEEEDEDDDASERDVRHEFHLGRFCATRTRVYHKFSHWEYSLYRTLQREIVEAGDETRGFVKVAYLGGIKPPRDLHDADRVTEWLDQRGIIEMELQKVRGMMDMARNLEREMDG